MRRGLIVMLATAFLLSGTVFGAVNIQDITFKTKDAGKVVFRHTSHIKQKGMANDCKVCHERIFSMKNKVHSTMAEMEQRRSCGACHDGTKAFALKECVRCHLVREITYPVKVTGPTRFSHKKHLVGTPDCGSCHPALFNAGPNKRVTMAEMKQGRSCGACHDGIKAFGTENCTSCHPVKDRTYAIKGAGKVTFSHAAHSGLYQCGQCHTKLYAAARSKTKATMKAMEKGKSCGACHNGTTAFSVTANCATCHRT